MKIIAIVETAKGRRLRMADGRGGKPADLETYFSPGQEISVYCSTAEREEFERDTGADLRDDVLTGDAFAKLVTWLKANTGAVLSGVYWEK